MRSMFVAAALLAAVPAQADILGDIAASGQLSIGVRPDATPFSFVDAQGQAAGYSVELCQEVMASLAEELGVALEANYVLVTATDRFTKIASGEIQIECATSSHTLARDVDFDFSLHTFATGAALLLRSDSGITTLADARGQRVAVRAGTTSAELLRQLNQAQNLAIEIVEVESYTAGLADLETAAVEALFGDRALLLAAQHRALDPAALKLDDDHYAREVYGLLLPNGDEAFRLAVNRALSRLYTSERFAAVYEKWFGPMGADAKAFFAFEALPLE